VFLAEFSHLWDRLLALTFNLPPIRSVNKVLETRDSPLLPDSFCGAAGLGTYPILSTLGNCYGKRVECPRSQCCLA